MTERSAPALIWVFVALIILGLLVAKVPMVHDLWRSLVGG